MALTRQVAHLLSLKACSRGPFHLRAIGPRSRPENFFRYVIGWGQSIFEFPGDVELVMFLCMESFYFQFLSLLYFIVRLARLENTLNRVASPLADK